MYKDINFLDLHIHTKYSMASSKYGDLYAFSESAKRKGIDIIGTGDAFIEEQINNIKKLLKEESNGIYIYNNQKFMLTVEVSLIYKEFDKTRKVHLLNVFKTLDDIIAVKKILKNYGKIESDGRPIFKLSVRDYVNIIKNRNNDTIIIPAHIWTPHFGIMGSKSGYDKLSETVENTNVFSALETGLSSDIEMNKLFYEGKDFNFVSFSDAHSPEKLGREATLIKSKKIEFDIIKNAFERKNNNLYGTIEFYPEEGKYFASGHRKCGYFTLKNETICPVCNKPLTEGVIGRIQRLSNNKTFEYNKNVFYSLPLEDILKHIKKKTGIKKSLKNIKLDLSNSIPEMYLKTFASINEIEDILGEYGAEFFDKMKKKKLSFIPGHDGVYGELSIKEDK